MNEPDTATRMDDPTSDDAKVSFSTDTSSHLSEESREGTKDSKEISQNSKQDSDMSDPKEDFQKQIENFISANRVSMMVNVVASKQIISAPRLIVTS